MDTLVEAVIEYRVKRSEGVRGLLHLENGLYAPPFGDRCELCENAQWSCSTGAHLKTEEHIALKWGIPIRDLVRAIEMIRYRPSSIAWKNLNYTPSSYLRSHWDGDFIWMPGETVEAQCDTCIDGPEEDCTCGLYFYWDPREAVNHTFNGVVVQCRVGGVVVEATKGCRAQYAKVIGVLSLGSLSTEKEREMAAMYNVPLVAEFTEDILYELAGIR